MVVRLPSAPARRASRTEPPVNTTKLIIENANYLRRIFSAPFVSSPSEDLAFLAVDYPGSSSADSTVLSGEPQTHLQGRLVTRVGPEERCFRLGRASARPTERKEWSRRLRAGSRLRKFCSHRRSCPARPEPWRMDTGRSTASTAADCRSVGRTGRAQVG